MTKYILLLTFFAATDLEARGLEKFYGCFEAKLKKSLVENFDHPSVLKILVSPPPTNIKFIGGASYVQLAVTDGSNFSPSETIFCGQEHAAFTCSLRSGNGIFTLKDGGDIEFVAQGKFNVRAGDAEFALSIVPGNSYPLILKRMKLSDCP